MAHPVILKSQNGRLYHFDLEDISAIVPNSHGMHVHIRHAHVSGGNAVSHDGGATVPQEVGEKLIEIIEDTYNATVHQC